MARDPDSQWRGYSAESYLKILEDNLYSIREPGLEFMHDNSPIYTANKVKRWFQDIGISTINWPPYSPDLNPIEHAWSKLKEIIFISFISFLYFVFFFCNTAYTYILV